ncbi:glycoside hydrolase family 16 protein [Seonamhaeicola aphaedonensis]|uniref:Glycosyl hydrolase family 16 n=1 Tax=Seonamhaeicola aphaedonensis TaxID=1461338 RepID=A0A3D9HLE0_9FLAO|nr:family 16 glycosylhydrolase [Seonamhaeicola aphaedonensis]RED50310.1 glycosyl hydrolase family 16 [Seonamhaeicola aphaedonensis]
MITSTKLKRLYFSFIGLTALLFVSCSGDEKTSPDDDQFDDGDNPVTIAKPVLNSINTSGWTLMFEDNFDSFEPTKWTKNNSTKSRAARPGIGINQWFWKPENVSYRNGNLVLRSEKVANDVLHCGGVFSNNLFEFKYGYIEAKIDIAETMFGTHTALWLQGDNMGNVDGTGNDGAEIDVFESAWVQDYTKSVVHIDGYGTSHKANTRKYDTPGIHSGYHIYGLLWNKDMLEVYYDGQFKTRYQGIWVPQVEEFLWLSTGASFGGTANFTSRNIGDFTEAKVDYVRVWRMN